MQGGLSNFHIIHSNSIYYQYTIQYSSVQLGIIFIVRFAFSEYQFLKL